MRKSFEKYLQERNVSHNRNIKNQGGGEFVKKFLYIISGFIIGIFFVASISYASGNRGTIGTLFNFLSSTLENGRPVRNVYRLDGANIRDKTVSHYELADGAVKTRNIYPGEVKTKNIGNFQVTKDKLAPGSVDASKISSAYTRNLENKIRTLENKINTMGGRSCGVYRHRYFVGHSGITFNTYGSPYYYKIRDLSHLQIYVMPSHMRNGRYSYSMSIHQCINGTMVTLLSSRMTDIGGRR